MTIVSVRTRNAARPHTRPLEPDDADALLSRAVLDMADEHQRAFLSHLGDERDQEHDERRAVIERFDGIARSDYCAGWNRSGRTFGTPLHRAALRQKIAEAADGLFRSSVKHGTVVGLPWPPAVGMKPSPLVGRRHGLTALCDQAEREWRRAHLAALGEQETARG